MPGDLPAELWLRIVNLIPDDHFASLFWVNRAFYQLATERKYRHLVLDDDRPSAVMGKLERIEYTPVSPLIKSISLYPRAIRSACLRSSRGLQKIPRKANHQDWPASFRLETRQFAIPEDVTLAERLLTGLSGLQNVNELTIEWMMASPPEIPFCFPLLAALFQSLGQQLTKLTLCMGLDQLCQLADSGPVLGSLQELSLDIGRSTLSEIRPEDATQGQAKLASFVNSLSPTLRKLSLSSSEHVRLEPPYLDEVFLPHLRSLAFHLPFDSHHVTNPQGLNSFLKLHTSISELSLIPRHCCKPPSKPGMMDSHEWLQEVFSGVIFDELLSLDLGLNILGGDSRIPPVAQFIGSVVNNLGCLTITGVLMSVEEIDAILTPFTRNGNTPPKKVVLEVYVLSRRILEKVLNTLPKLDTLDLTYRWINKPGNVDEAHHVVPHKPVPLTRQWRVSPQARKSYSRIRGMSAKKRSIAVKQLISERTLAEHMNPDIVIYEPQDLLDHFFPPLPEDCKQEDIKAIKEELEGKSIAKKPPQPPCQSDKKTFESLAEVCRIIGGRRFETKKRNRLVFRLVPNGIVESDVDGTQFRMYGCFEQPNSTKNGRKSTKGRSRSKSKKNSEASKYTREPLECITTRPKSTRGPSKSTEGSKSKMPSDPLDTTSIIVPVEVKVQKTFDMVRQNHLHVCSSVSHIMNDDVRRMFMLAITIEEDQMTLWYFSRSAYVKSKSFNFVKNKDFVIKVMISLMFATDEELGLDPRVQIRPQEDSKSPRQYIYEFPSEAGLKFSATTESISFYRTLHVSGRKTRVFKVIEVEREGARWHEKGGATPMVLKDVWLDDGAKSEQEIQNAIFADIQSFADQPDWKSNPHLQAFNSPETGCLMANLESVLRHGNYKSLFLIVRAENVGKPSKPLVKGAYFPDPEAFYSRDTPGEGSAMCSGTSRHAPPDASARSHRPNIQSEADEEVETSYRIFAPKRRSFFLFDEECTPVDRVPTVGDAFSVLKQCITALLLMFCAGWVHRDISAGNVMAVRDPNGEGKVKLADLEHAKQFGEGKGTSDPKTGTPFFMPHEILARDYVNVGKIPVHHVDQESSDDDDKMEHLHKGRAKDRPPEAPVRHNFQHDLESGFWIALWIVTRRVDHLPSRKYARTIFTNPPNLHLAPARGSAFTKNIKYHLLDCLLQPLLPLAGSLERLRSYLHGEARLRGEAESWDDLSSYSNVHALLANRLNHILSKPQAWAEVNLAPREARTGNPFIEDDVAEDELNLVKIGTSLTLKRSLPPGGGNFERRSKRGRPSNNEEDATDPATHWNTEGVPSNSLQTLPSRTRSDASEMRRSIRIQARMNSSTRSTWGK